MKSFSQKIFNDKKRRPSFSMGLFFVVFLFILMLASPKLVEAVSKLRGAAWWGSDLGFIYFSCKDYETGSRFDRPGNFNDLPEPRGFHFFIGGCVIDHNVVIGNDGNISGAAYNGTKGMINFGGSSTPVTVPDYSFNSNCLNTCDATNSCSACYNSVTQRLYGYAQASSSGELIRLDSNFGAGPPVENNLQLKNWDLSDSINPFYSGVEPGDFLGHASSTVSGVHQSLSFNCLSQYGSDNGGSCAEDGMDNYKVYLGEPEVGRMTAPNWPFESACSPGNAKRASLKWSLKGGVQSGYEVVVTRTNSLATSSPDTVCYSGFQVGSATQYNIPNAGDNFCTTTADLDYNTSYYWFVRLYYLEEGVHTAGEWYQFGLTDGHQGELYDEDNSFHDDGSGLTFTTYKHEFPTPYFDWSPKEIIVGATSTIFTALNPGNRSKYYTSASPSVAIDCTESGNCSYLWSSIDVSVDIYDPSSASTTIVFNRATSTLMDLEITDLDSYVCSTSTLVTNINYGLPVWREVKAE